MTNLFEVAADVVVAVLLLAGSFLALVAAIGVVRFPDTLTRMHAATKPQILSLILTLTAAGITVWGSVDIGMIVLAILFACLTVPVVAHRVGRLAHREGLFREDLTTINQMEPNRDD
ncbi:monovalent cation/H(+) antiporter subunit G [Hoyosella rhizosphaerae]|uniref:Na+/H+ antiporter subunit G n=1 Tax=Hoyosella rhizosphaerae TaxID=1755582 RepID=A0A916XCH1_9ACTN|nr:monovalent cation/H(+) antiporter subunit G [Hoyosella rhizosphaerae]MBN4927778.1 monovalent cation/H(+) antiporter subunit G [Hoyosella rhizosphaerae]GGC61610.1 Na+/H+ antiporter subunit G [Hoyosella rhizosphaerae]